MRTWSSYGGKNLVYNPHSINIVSVTPTFIRKTVSFTWKCYVVVKIGINRFIKLFKTVYFRLLRYLLFAPFFLSIVRKIVQSSVCVDCGKLTRVVLNLVSFVNYKRISTARRIIAYRKNFIIV